MKSENEIVQSIAAQECAAAQHRSVTYFEDAPCYPIEKLVKLLSEYLSKAKNR